MHRKYVVRAALLAVVLIAAMILPSSAASTTKALSTNFTLVNLGEAPADGSIQYFTAEGGTWKPNDTFANMPPGGQLIYRQYSDPNLPSGQGSVVVNASETLGSVVQVQARSPQVPTTGAYVGFNAGSQKAYVPLVMRRVNGASGLGNSQVVVQNAGQAATDVKVTLIGLGASAPATYEKTKTGLAVGASWVYDLDDESALTAGWYGSAVVEATTSGGSIVAVSSLFTGPNGMQVFNAFTTPGNTWLAPLFTSRLANGLSTPITIQNLSGAEIPANGITVTCTKNPLSAGQNTLSIKNSAPVPANASFGINPVVDMTLPADWYGSCRISSSAGVVAFVQMRRVGTDMAAAYEALSGASTDKQVLIPLAAKRLANGFATVLNLQNISESSAATIDVTYIPSAEYVANGGSNQQITEQGVQIPAGGSIQRNLRLVPTVPQMPDGWYGTVKIVSRDQPINAIVELTFLTGAGDTYQAHTAFTKP